MELISKASHFRRKFLDWKRKREADYYGTALFDKLASNPLPIWLLFSLITYVLILLGKYIPYLASFLIWFVKTLEITKILKIPFLDNDLYYQYLALFGYIYISVSLLWDGSRLWERWSTELVLVKKEVWILQKTMLGKKLNRIQLESNQFVLEWEHSSWLNWFGLNRLLWKENQIVVLRSPYFFPWGKNKKILNQILRRTERFV